MNYGKKADPDLCNSYIADVLQTGAHVISGLLVLYIISKKDKGANKVTWVFLILLFPMVGGPLYLLYLDC